MIKPTGAQYYHDGVYYKQGAHDLVFMRINGEWKKSTKRWWLITKEGKKQ